MSKERFEQQNFSYDDVVEAVKYGVNYGIEEEEQVNIPEGNIQQWLESTKTRTADEWQKLFPDILVIDPDGWKNSESHKKAWYEEQITYQEYIHRREQSTCMFKKRKDETDNS